MRLVVLASTTARSPAAPDVRTLRLMGLPVAGETPLPDAALLADMAGREMRERFPAWLWQHLQASDALTLHLWPGPVSWWWYMPLSEMSPLRSALIRELYWLTLFRLVFKRHTVDLVEWVGDDPLLMQAARQIAEQSHVAFQAQRTGCARHGDGLRMGIERFKYFCRQGLQWGLLKCLGYSDKHMIASEPTLALYSRFPSGWELDGANWRDRMYGTWATELRQRGKSFLFAAVFTGRAADLWKKRLVWVERCRQHGIVFLETFVSLFDLLRAHLPVRFFFHYWAWRSRQRRRPVQFGEIEIGDLWWREMDANVFNPELPLDLTLFAAMRALVQRAPQLQAVFHSFEFQPMERAIWSGAKTERVLPVVGIQTGLYCSNQMGLAFLKEEVRLQPEESLKAPIPDYLAASGALPYRVFSSRLGPSRVSQAGPVRYPALPKFMTAELDEFRRANALPDGAAFVLVLTSIEREESLAILRNALDLLAANPRFFLLIKFHYLLPLDDVLKEMTSAQTAGRIRLFKSDLYRLMATATMAISGGSSAGIEAIATGCMPLVYRPIDAMPCNPMLDVPESFFFWNTSKELHDAVQSCLSKDAAYEKRRAHWAQALQEHLSPMDSGVNERLCQFLQKEAVL